MTQQSKMTAAFERARPGIGRQAELMRELSALVHRFTVRGFSNAEIRTALIAAADRLPGEGQKRSVNDDQMDNSNARKPIGGEEQPRCVDKARALLSSPANPIAGGEQIPCAEKARSPASPIREPSSLQTVAARKVATKKAVSFWDRTVGGELKLRASTKTDWINFARKFSAGHHICNRMITEIDWPDDEKTTLEQIASEKRVQEILNSGPLSLAALESHHA